MSLRANLANKSANYKCPKIDEPRTVWQANYLVWEGRPDRDGLMQQV